MNFTWNTIDTVCTVVLSIHYVFVITLVYEGYFMKAKYSTYYYMHYFHIDIVITYYSYDTHNCQYVTVSQIMRCNFIFFWCIMGIV